MTLRRNILVPVDFRAPSSRACDRAVALGRDLRARVTLLHVIDAPEDALPAEGLVRRRELAERTMCSLANELRPSGTELETRIVEGTPWRAIVAAIDEGRPDFVVCGTHNRRGLARFAFGSVAERIVRTSKVPVITVSGFAYESREDAGARLLLELPRHDLPGALSIVALGLDALPIADVVARKLRTVIDVWDFVPIEIGGQRVGALGEDEQVFYDVLPDVPPSERAEAEERAKVTLREQLQYVRGTRSMGDVLDRLVVLVAEHVTSPAAIRAATRALRPFGVSGVILATPIASSAAMREVRALVDGVVCLEETLAANPRDVAYRRSSPLSYRKARQLLSTWRGDDDTFSTRFAS